MIVSVVITVYNCDKYLDRCFSSIKEQTYKKLDIIVVDDGSQDMSPQICDEFAQNDNVRVIHKQNAGTVLARKTGVSAATGEVVVFIDGDDWVDKDYIARLVKPFEEYEDIDVVSSGLFFEYPYNPEKNCILLDGTEQGVYNKESIDDYLLPNYIYDIKRNTSSITTSVCCKMIKRCIVLAAMEVMDENLTMGEDGAFVLAILVRTTKMYVISNAFYHYEQHSLSQNYKCDITSLDKIKKLKNCMNKIIENHDKKRELQLQINYYIKSYLRFIEKHLFEIEDCDNVFLLPYTDLKKSDRVIIHGAGKVGQQYIKNLICCKQCELIGWTDKNSDCKYVSPDKPCSLNEITKMDYDYILLASNEYYILKQMQDDLKKYGISQDKILMNKPIVYRI